MRNKYLPIIILTAMISVLVFCSKDDVQASDSTAASAVTSARYIPEEYIVVGQDETIVNTFPSENRALLLSTNKNGQYHVYSFDFVTLSAAKYADFSAPILDTVDVDTSGIMYGIYTDADANVQLITVDAGDVKTEPLALPNEIIGNYITRVCILNDGARAVQIPDHIYVISATGEIIADKGEYPGNTEIIRCADSGFFLISSQEDSTCIEKLNANFEHESEYNIPWVYEEFFVGPPESSNIICAYAKNIMYLLNVETGESEPYANFSSSGSSTQGFVYINTESYLSIYNNQPAIWTLAPDDDVVVLTLATCSGTRLQWDELLNTAVSAYNAQSSKYRVEIYDYSTLNNTSESDSGMTQFRIDVIAGKTPDIYDLWSLPSPSLLSSGLLENLYPYFNSAPEYDLIDSAMKTLDCGGKLYELVPSFDIATVFCDSSISDELEHMSLQELSKLYSASQIFGGTVSRNDFLLYLIVYSGKSYVDNSSSTCSLNSPEFIEMLEFSAELNEEEDWSYDPTSAVFNGKQMIFISTTEDPVYEYQYANALFHQQAKLVGFPTNAGTGVSMAPRLRIGMSANSKEKAGVWDFMEYLLSDSFQAKAGGIRIRKDVMLPIIKAQIDAYSNSKKKLGVFYYDDQGNSIQTEAPFQPLPQSTENDIWAYINLIDGTNEYDDTVLEIIQQEAEKYYDGYCSAEEAAERMQKRVSLYLAEQS